MTYVIGYVQDEPYITIEHKDVRRDCENFARRVIKIKVPSTPLLSHGVVGGEPEWLVIARTRHEDIHVGSVATSLSLTVLAITNHPGSGNADDIPNG